MERLEAAFGDRLVERIRRHHRRRLARVGWAHALEPPPGDWAVGEPPVRPGNGVDVLVDGAQALPVMADAIRGATSHVHVAGFCFTPGFALERNDPPVVLRNLLAEVAERADVRVLSWAGAPLPLFKPSRRAVRKMRDDLTAGSKIRCELDARERPLHCHHEKTIVVDDRVAFVGGIDLTSDSGDRYDTSLHPSRAAIGWHDAAVRLVGPCVADVAEHFRMRWREVTGETLPAPAPSAPAEAGIEAQVVRTIPERIYDAVPRGDFRILESYVRAFRDARRFIYAENQFLWSSEIANVLIEKLRHPPCDDFRIVFVLPARPNSGEDDTRGVLGELIDADDGAGRVLACALYARSGPLADPVYVHAKVGIVDDEWLTIGSANLNEHSLFNDTELNVVVRDPLVVRTTRRRLWSEHLERPARRAAPGSRRDDRQAVAVDQRRAAPPPAGRRAADPPARPAAERVEKVAPGARAAGRARGGRLNLGLRRPPRRCHIVRPDGVFESVRDGRSGRGGAARARCARAGRPCRWSREPFLRAGARRLPVVRRHVQRQRRRLELLEVDRARRGEPGGAGPEALRRLLRGRRSSGHDVRRSAGAGDGLPAHALHALPRRRRLSYTRSASQSRTTARNPGSSVCGSGYSS